MAFCWSFVGRPLVATRAGLLFVNVVNRNVEKGCDCPFVGRLEARQSVSFQVRHGGSVLASRQFEPHPYGHAVHRVAAEILADRDAMIRIEFGADDICGPCRHNIDGLCDDTIDTSFRPQAPKPKRQYNLLLDERWAERLGLRPGDELTARQFCLLLRDRAGDITDIYRENPAERTSQRQMKLQNGLAWFLA